MEFNKRTSVKDDLRKYDHLANKDSIIQVTQWANGEGWDISINDEPVISLTWGQLDAINYLVNTIQFQK
jgi:hypothetical protein